MKWWVLNEKHRASFLSTIIISIDLSVTNSGCFLNSRKNREKIRQNPSCEGRISPLMHRIVLAERRRRTWSSIYLECSHRVNIDNRCRWLYTCRRGAILTHWVQHDHDYATTTSLYEIIGRWSQYWWLLDNAEEGRKYFNCFCATVFCSSLLALPFRLSSLKVPHHQLPSVITSVINIDRFSSTQKSSQSSDKVSTQSSLRRCESFNWKSGITEAAVKSDSLLCVFNSTTTIPSSQFQKDEVKYIHTQQMVKE